MQTFTFFSRRKIVIVYASIQDNMLFIIYLCCTYRKCKKIPTLSHVEFNNLWPNLTNDTRLAECNRLHRRKILWQTHIPKRERNIFSFFYESWSQFVLGCNLIKVSICTKYTCVCICLFEPQSKVEIYFPIGKWESYFTSSEHRCIKCQSKQI